MGLENCREWLSDWSVSGDISVRDLNASVWRKSIPDNNLRGPAVKMSLVFSKDRTAGMAATE